MGSKGGGVKGWWEQGCKGGALGVVGVRVVGSRVWWGSRGGGSDGGLRVVGGSRE